MPPTMTIVSNRVQVTIYLVAKTDYAKLLAKWRLTQLDETLTDPSNDCLAFSRFFYCSFHFKRCDDTKE